MLSNIENSSTLFERHQTSSACLSNNSFNMKVIMEQWWNDKEKPKNEDKNVCQNHFVNHTVWAGAGSNLDLRGEFTE